MSGLDLDQYTQYGFDFELDHRLEGRAHGRVLRDEAMRQVAEHSPISSEVLYEVACQLARTSALSGEPFTGDDVWDAVGEMVVREKRVLGPVMRRLGSNGVAYNTGLYRQAHRGINHARPQALWQGRL